MKRFHRLAVALGLSTAQIQKYDQEKTQRKAEYTGGSGKNKPSRNHRYYKSTSECFGERSEVVSAIMKNGEMKKMKLKNALKKGLAFNHKGAVYNL